MKRYGNLYPQIVDFENLLIASRKAQKGKRYRDNVLRFNFNLENELIELKSSLVNKTYHPKAYKTFYIKEPKERMISAAPYVDRIVHHALCNVIIPIFERSYIHDSYANRVGFGTHRALRRFTKFARSSKYVLQCDLQKYFPSIDLEILKQKVRHKIKCVDTLWLIDTIIDNSNEQIPVIEHFAGDSLLTPLERRRGLPIGNLTSQFLSNIYLNHFDHFIEEKIQAGIGIKKYLRYVDDFALFSDDLDFLKESRIGIEEYLASIRLKIHPIKSQIFETKQGANFLGFRIFLSHIRVRSENLHRAKNRIYKLHRAYQSNQVSLLQISQSLQSWFAHLQHGNTWRLRQKIFTSLAWTTSQSVEKG